MFNTRTDCKRDNRATPVPNACKLGYGLWRAKRGNWIAYAADGEEPRYGRVVGGVTCEGVRYIECVRLGSALSHPCVAWVNPAAVRECMPVPPRNALEFICGDWTDMAKVSAVVNYGIPTDAATRDYQR